MSADVQTPDIVGFRTENRSTQTRFHFHADRCVGCHACEVACAEQNGLPADVQWRRVGEVETGCFPDTKRFYISSGCNHCLDAPCMKGCPTDAYQVNARGIVVHVDDACIGCQYCTWNCPYGVPTYQPDRRIVTKCDLCTNRLDEGRDPACVQACPAEAIVVETVPLDEVLENFQEEGVGPDMPDPAISMPSTKITLPAGTNLDRVRKVDRDFVRPEDPHTPLIWMTVLTQLGLGGIASIVLCDVARALLGLEGIPADVGQGLAPAMMILVGISFLASTLHLGRPFYAYRAMKNWRTSWLSREVAGLSAFAGLGAAFAAITVPGVLPGLPDAPVAVLGVVTILSGVAGVYCSARLYRVPARPAWDSRVTTVDFFLTALTLGPIVFCLAAGLWAEPQIPPGVCAGFAAAALAGTVARLALQAGVTRSRGLSMSFELEATATLYLRRFRGVRACANLLAGAGLLAGLPVVTGSVVVGEAAFTVAAVLSAVALTASCLIQRYLFFVTVVPKNIPGNFHVVAYAAQTT